MTATLRLTGRPFTLEPATNNSAVPVLVVDDNAAKRLALKAVLAPLGYTIVEADSGEACLRCVIQRDFAVILLDVRMPIMDGFETAALIRLRRQSETTPIIFITAHASDEIPSTNRYAQGAVDFITSPVQPDELRAKVAVFGNLFLKAEGFAAKARQVQASADQLRLLTEAAPIGIFQTDEHNRYVYTNPRWAEITGITSAEATGQPWDVIIDTEQRVEMEVGVTERSIDEQEFSHRLEIHNPGEATKIVHVTSRSIRDSTDTVIGWVGTVAEITAVAEAEAAMSQARDEATEASRLKSDFLANMSHEIRTPMNGVIGMTDLLLETDLDEKQRDYAVTVRNSGEALLTVINDILDFSKIETGKMEIQDIAFSPLTIVHDVVDLLKLSAQTKGLELKAVVAESVPALVRGDPGRIRQVLTNLIGNAVKFTQAGGIEVRVNAIHDTASEIVVRFEVVDTGVGIAPDKLAIIFEPFAQADTSTSRKYGGTGLGLAISGQLAALMGGNVGVDSRQDEGSTFWFTVRVHPGADDGVPLGDTPAAPRYDPAAPPPSPAAPRRSGEPSRGRLLLAEDNLINQKVAVAMLTNAGYQVETVLTGQEAVTAASAQTYDAILMDCQMPELNGYEATLAIRAAEGGSRHTPIITLTAGARTEDKQRCIDATMDHYLSKPVSKDALLDVVRQAMRGRHSVDLDPATA